MNARKKLAIAALAVVGVLAVGSLAWAAVPDASGVIHGCYDTASGALRVTDTATNKPKGCGSKETALTWSQQGPQGETGPSDGYSRQTNNTPVPAGNAYTTLTGTLDNLPAGSYLISGSAVWDTTVSGTSQIRCQFASTNAYGSSIAGFGLATMWSEGGAPFSGWMIITPGKTGTLGVQCKQLDGTDPIWISASVQAIRVGTLHTQ